VARRNLGDVLHYFISEDEQQEARSRSGSGRVGSIALPASPDRPVSCALALELASALAPNGARIVSSFAPSPLAPRVPGVTWTEVADLAGLLTDPRAERASLVVERPSELARLLERVAPRTLDALLLPVAAAPLGLAQALGFLRGLAPALSGRRVLVLALGAASDAAGAELAARLAGAAERQLGLRVERLGELAFDAAGYRSLLRGESLQSTPGASARALRELGAKLAGRAAA
jgi:hypothetical protein